ncbi:hypothetical protein DOT_5833 [Desulfosporosinus sp. OT]|nr:hypothetical protein DOT_5833 [Desulfosporosinus sp. OT]
MLFILATQKFSLLLEIEKNKRAFAKFDTGLGSTSHILDIAV